MRCISAIATALLLAALAAAASGLGFAGRQLRDEESWNCTSILKTQLVPGAIWQKMNCSSEWLFGEPIGPLTLNVISADLTATNVRVVPMMASQSVEYGLQSIPDMATQRTTLFAGINGGYFWELNNPTFIDDVCLGKTRAEASTPPSVTNTQYGPGDTLLIIDGKLCGSNCKSVIYDVPIVFVMNGTSSYIQRMPEAGRLPFSVQNAIAAGPNLVSFDSTLNSSYIDVPLDDFDPNVWGHSANTAIALSGSWSAELNEFVATTFWMATVDGHDGGNDFEPTSGLSAREFAHYLKYYLDVQMAMGMDQGGSTTMWIKGQPNEGVVSNAWNNQPGQHAPREVFNGIFLETISS